MKASELIARLGELMAEHGDMLVHVVDYEWCEDNQSTAVEFLGVNGPPRFVIDVDEAKAYAAGKVANHAYRQDHIKQQEAVFAQMRNEGRL